MTAIKHLPQAVREAKIKNFAWLFFLKTVTNIWYKVTASTAIQRNDAKMK